MGVGAVRVRGGGWEPDGGAPATFDLYSALNYASGSLQVPSQRLARLEEKKDRSDGMAGTQRDAKSRVAARRPRAPG
ncbi:hypothetical protein HaLaN_00494, partial [Haematococcus lacustris]